MSNWDDKGLTGCFGRHDGIREVRERKGTRGAKRN